MPAAEWISIGRSGSSEQGRGVSLATLEAAVRLLELGLEHDQAAPISQRVAERLAETLSAERVELLQGGQGWSTEWSWPNQRGGFTAALGPASSIVSRESTSAADWPIGLLAEALDRGAASALEPAGARPGMLICPLDPKFLPNRVPVAAPPRRPVQRAETELLPPPRS